jgi:mono/diheme cytochrome c family protein
MRRISIEALGVAALIFGASWPPRAAQEQESRPVLRETRSSPLDLEIAGNLAGLPAGSVRYLTREELLALPQVSFTAVGDTNFEGPTKISGVALEELARRFAAAPGSDLIDAICVDKYRAYYPRAYVEAHHPALVLEIDGKPPAGWPKYGEGAGMDMGPFMISHPKFAPAFTVRSHAEEAQIPWGVVRIEFRDEKEVFGAIAPRGPQASDAAVQDGYRIAEQNCVRCHNLGGEGGQKSGLPWTVLAAFASGSPDFFAAYVRDPKAKNPKTQMPGRPDYDDATIHALTEYFRTFSAAGRP